jgi:Ca2+-binding RTX toxin-like protein
MATFTTNFPTLAFVESRHSAFESALALSVSNAVSWGSFAYANANYYRVASYSSISSTFVSGTFTNGDTFAVTGSNLTGSPYTVSRLVYRFSSGMTVTLDGAVTYSGSGDPAGSITRVEVAYARSRVIIEGYADVARNDGLIQRATVIAYTDSTRTVELGRETFRGSIAALTTVNAQGFIVTTLGGTISELSFASAGYQGTVSGVNWNLASVPDTETVADFLAWALNGNDLVSGGTGPNELYGYAGNDTLDGGAGADTMLGGPGDDTYIVDNLGDVIVELSGQGLDTVRSSVGRTLGANQENLVLTGSSAINGTGNTLRNVITGNAAANVLDGKGGADTLIGGADNDTYVVNAAGDLVVELAGGGTDLVKAWVNYTLPANVEKLALMGVADLNGTGNTLPNMLTGNAGANRLSGSGGADAIHGKGGMDTLTGGAGADRFYFNTALGAGNVDLITDFTPGTDKICLDDDIFAALGPVGALASSNFALGSSATTSVQRILYDAASGALYYDPDGSGPAARIRFATLGTATHPAISAADFQIVA